ncbi:Uncharacterized protein FKW44_023505 [Caligus rogercresseyi]|uniref:Uncharacterized protein n=1 Tax=Caligus rogercresseyi TaxID=217165 RepID=A0A7T8JU84_CALRO|nr:Uncharacterized protein FKW44_023505 [Caligus rogercresseyi]
MEDKRIRVSALLDAQMDFKRLLSSSPAPWGSFPRSRSSKMRDKTLEGNLVVVGTTRRGRRSSWPTSDTIEASPTTSRPRILGSARTPSECCSGLGPVSYVRRRRQLLSDSSKETRFIKAQRVHGPDLAIHLTMASGAIPHASVDALKAAVEKEWAEMSVDFIVKTCKAFSPDRGHAEGQWWPF